MSKSVCSTRSAAGKARMLFGILTVAVFSVLVLVGCSDDDDKNNSIGGGSAPSSGLYYSEDAEMGFYFAGDLVYGVEICDSTYYAYEPIPTLFAEAVFVMITGGIPLSEFALILAGFLPVSVMPQIVIEPPCYGGSEDRYPTEGTGSIGITIDMFDGAGDGWDDGGSLTVSVNGTPLRSVRVQNGASATYRFLVNDGDVVSLSYNRGSFDSENSFVMYYTEIGPGYPLYQRGTLGSASGLLTTITIGEENLTKSRSSVSAPAANTDATKTEKGFKKMARLVAAK